MSEKNIQRIVLIAFCLSGAAALIYEVVWTRALSLVLGSTVYALSTMLATFMAGLAIGAYFGGKIADRKANLLVFFGTFEIGIGLFGIITVPVIYSLPPLYFWFYEKFHLAPTIYFVFQFLLCALIMLIPTTLMGATFPIVSRRITEGMEEMGRKVGDAYSVNTLGAIAGSLTAGFVLIPLIGMKWASFTAGIINISVGISVVLLSRVSKVRAVGIVSVFVAALGGFVTSYAHITHPNASFYEMMRYKDFNELKSEEQSIDVLMSQDYAQGHIMVLKYKMGHGLISIRHNGKLEGTLFPDVPNTMMLATVPAVALPRKPKYMLVIGLGAGVTAWTGRNVAQNVDVVEINPGVVDAVKKFGLPDTLKGVQLHLTDARKHLLYSHKRFDIITSEPSVPSESMSASLFTREFYEIASERLEEGGIYCQWLPAWALTKQDARSCIKTFASVFDHVYLWRVLSSNDFLMIGSTEPFRYRPDEIADKAVRMGEALFPVMFKNEMAIGSADLRKFFELNLIRDDESIKEILSMNDVPVMTDDRPMLEFFVTMNLLLGPDFKSIRK